MLSKEEIENKISLKDRTKYAIEKSKEIRENHKNDKGDCSLEVSLAYDMQYVKKYIEELEKENTDLQKSVEQIYNDYQDAGKKMFEYSDKLEQIGKAVKVNIKAIRKEDTFNGKTIKAFLKSILKTIKGDTKKC